jgi:hypothetical protein
MTTFPSIRVDSIRRIVDDSQHNAFPDLCRWNGRYYLTHRRSPIGHQGVNDAATVIILSSPDGVRWHEEYQFGAAGHDVRDPHFLIFGGRLRVIVGSCVVGAAERCGFESFVVESDDGQTWTPARPMADIEGQFAWRTRAFQGRAYLTTRRVWRIPGDPDRRTTGQTLLWESDDARLWRQVAVMEEGVGNEAAFLFDDEGEITAIVRQRSFEAALLCQSRPPYRQWTRGPLPRIIGGPMLERWGEHRLVGGRKWYDYDDPLRRRARTALAWLVGDELVDALELPSGGDNSYPALVTLGNDRAVLVYYSSHEGSGGKSAPSFIYWVELSLH